MILIIAVVFMLVTIIFLFVIFAYQILSLKKAMITRYFYVCKPNVLDLLHCIKYGKKAVTLHLLPQKLRGDNMTDKKIMLAKDFGNVYKYVLNKAENDTIYITSTTEFFAERIMRCKFLEVIEYRKENASGIMRKQFTRELKTMYGDHAIGVEVPQTFSKIIFRRAK